MSVMQLYRNAWRLEKHETPGQRLRDVLVSIVAPSVALWATVDACRMYWNTKDPYRFLAVLLILLGATLSLLIFVLACRVLTRPRSSAMLAFATTLRLRRRVSGQGSALPPLRQHADAAADPHRRVSGQGSVPPRNSAMLAFATWLFPMGLAFTLAETYDVFWGPIGPLKEVVGCPVTPGIDSVRCKFNSPWGDVLLAFSAFCMLVEEFSLLNLYDDVEKKLSAARKQYSQAQRRHGVAEEDARKIHSLCGDAEKDRKKINRIFDQTKRYFEDVESMRRKLRKERRPIRVFLKQCFASFMVGVAIWVLMAVLLYFPAKLGKLETAINDIRTAGDTGETNGDPEGTAQEAPEDESEDAGDRGQTPVGPETNDTSESSTANPIGSPDEDGEDTSRPDDLDDGADGTTPTR